MGVRKIENDPVVVLSHCVGTEARTPKVLLKVVDSTALKLSRKVPYFADQAVAKFNSLFAPYVSNFPLPPPLQSSHFFYLSLGEIDSSLLIIVSITDSALDT